MIFALRFQNRKVVDRGKPGDHQPVFIELPVLIAVGAVPVTGVIMPLVSEADSDAVPVSLIRRIRFKEGRAADFAFESMQAFFRNNGNHD